MDFLGGLGHRIDWDHNPLTLHFSDFTENLNLPIKKGGFTYFYELVNFYVLLITFKIEYDR